MKLRLIKKAATLTAIACAMLASQAAVADDAFINPEWANSAWYIGAGFGQTRANIDEQSIARALTANGESAVITVHERRTGYKLFMGKQLSRHFAVEGGFFDLGDFKYEATTSGNGVLNGEARFRGFNLDLIGQLPLTERLSAYARIGAHYTKASDRFTGNRLVAVTNPNPSESKLNAKAGLGVEYKLSEPLALRFEAERYRVNDAIGNRGDIDLYAVNLVYKLGRPARVPVVYTPPPAAEPMPAPPVVQPAPAPAPAPVPVSEKVSFAAETLFDFDKSVVKPAGKAALDDLLAKMQGMDTEVMITVGHTDAIGTDAYNQKLSMRRAAAVKAYLISTGVDASRVYTEGKGEAQPVADNKTAAGRAQNRRVTVEVVGTRTVTR